MFITPRSSVPFVQADLIAAQERGLSTLVPAPTAPSGRDVGEHVRIERDRTDSPNSHKDTAVPATPASQRRPGGFPATGPARPDREADRPDTDVPFAGWIRRARAAGHPVVAVVPGRFRPDPMPIWRRSMPPLELLEAAQEYARAQVEWVYVVMPSMRTMVALSASIAGPRPSGPARRSGSPASVPWRVLVAQQRIAPRATSVTRDGDTVHLVEIPVFWLPFPIRPVGPPVDDERPGDPGARLDGHDGLDGHDAGPASGR